MLTSSGTELGQSHYIREARCCGEETMVLKKGPWSLEEDTKLTAYINKYGICNWRRIPEAAGLSRCGKSCRIRWMNYLDPQVKRGNFTCEEDETIARMHKVLGNKWSEIAAALPGRTNNEIKNHWHTSLSKHLKREVIEQSQASSTMIDDSNIDLTAHHHFPDMTEKSVAVDLGILGDDQNHCNNPVTDFMEAPPSGGYDQDPNQQPKKKPFCHPTQDQEMEVFFIECLYPDDEQKTELAKRLSLAPSQVKFWFQKKQKTFDTHHFKDMTQETPEHKSPVNLGDDEDHSNKSGTGIMETPSGDYNQVSNQLLKKKWARHSQLQIQELEAFFYECPDPDDRQRKELSSRLSLGPLQVQSWFQQKRIQVKAKLERRENVRLRAENELLRADNMRCREALTKATCPFCGFSGDMLFGGPNFTKILFEQEHLKRETPSTTDVGLLTKLGR